MDTLKDGTGLIQLGVRERNEVQMVLSPSNMEKQIVNEGGESGSDLRGCLLGPFNEVLFGNETLLPSLSQRLFK